MIELERLLQMAVIIEIATGAQAISASGTLTATLLRS